MECPDCEKEMECDNGYYQCTNCDYDKWVDEEHDYDYEVTERARDELAEQLCYGDD